MNRMGLGRVQMGSGRLKYGRDLRLSGDIPLKEIQPYKSYIWEAD